VTGEVVSLGGANDPPSASILFAVRMPARIPVLLRQLFYLSFDDLLELFKWQCP
jgi:hypothetical protein